jgi:transmembrane sensor
MFEGQDLMQQIANAGARIDPALSDRDVERLIAGGLRRRRRRRTGRMALAAGVACAMALTATVLLRRAPATRTEIAIHPPQSQTPDDNRVFHLSDGSTAMALDPSTQLAVAEDADERVTMTLGRGRGRFNVTPKATRSFVVRVGDVTVTVLGTQFTVERIADRVGITVERGTVHVDWGVGSATLREGTSGWYPPLVMSATDQSTTSSEKVRVPAPRPAKIAPSLASTREVRPLPEPSAKVETAEELLTAADGERLAGQPARAADLLRKLLREHRRDARAPLAAFTLGRMLLMELSQPLEAAAVFAQTRSLAPHGPLAEDALAREVEALSAAAATDLAKTRAEEYLRLYPDGRRATTVRMLVGIK